MSSRSASLMVPLKAIADNLGKDKSTIGKEIRAHRYLSHKSTLSLECENYAHCKFKKELYCQLP